MKKLIAICLVMVFALSLVACKQASDTGTATEGTVENEQAGTAEESAESTEAAEPAQEIIKGGVLTVSGSTPTTLAWYDVRGIMAVAFMGYIYEPIMRYGADGVPEPFLAESVTPDAENLTWTIVLRDGILFSDGSACDAEAVAWNLNYYKENGVLSASFFKSFVNAEATDDKTIVCEFSEWDSLFDYSLCRTVLVASKQAYDTNGQEWLEQNPIGTGPFTLQEFNSDVNMYMVRNDSYWQGEVYLDAVNVVYYQNELVAATSLNTGEIQGMVTENYSIVEQLNAYDGITAQAAALPSYYYTMCFNMQSGDPCADVLVRKAISYAIDTQALIDTLTFGYAVQTDQWCKTDSPFYNEDVEGQPYDPAKAKELLSEAGYPDGFSTTITYASTTLLNNVAQIIQEQLAAVGIQATLQAIEGAAYVNYIGGWDEGMLIHTMGAESGAASQYASTFYQYDGFGLGVNAFEVSDELDAITTSITSAMTSDEIAERTQAVAKKVIDEDVMIKVIFGTQAIAFVRDEVKDHNFCTVQNMREDVWQTWISE
jgi:ABC-type transport system substrate-binding protein